MKDAGGHGSAAHGAHASGVDQVGGGLPRSGKWKRDKMGGYVHPASGWTITPSADIKGNWIVSRPSGAVFDSHPSVNYLKRVYGGPE
jgi:hypothetical protein